MIGLERIGDLLLNCSNRAAAVGSRIDLQDIRDLTLMASRLEKMLGDVHDAFSQRDMNKALAVLRADAEMDRLRNLVFMRHLDQHDNSPRQESFHVLFMTQALERAGDHAKNLAEEVCHLVSGHTVRHVLRSYDKPVEQMFIDDLRRKQKARETQAGENNPTLWDIPQSGISQHRGFSDQRLSGRISTALTAPCHSPHLWSLSSFSPPCNQLVTIAA